MIMVMFLIRVIHVLLLPMALAISPSLSFAWTIYRKSLVEHPLLTKAVTSSVLMTFSDAVVQHLESRCSFQEKSASPAVKLVNDNLTEKGRKRTFHHSFLRSRQSLLTGLIWSGPIAHYWYEFLEKLVNNPIVPVPTIPVVRLATRIILDAILFSPFTLAGFFTISTLAIGGTWFDIRYKLEVKWYRALVAAWSFWPIVNVVNFSLVPLMFRVLFANFMSLLWTGYLSYENNRMKNALPVITSCPSDTKIKSI